MPTFQAIAYEYTVEMTYPLPEAMSASLLNGFSQVCTMPRMLAWVLLLILADSQYRGYQRSGIVCDTGYWCL